MHSFFPFDVLIISFYVSSRNRFEDNYTLRQQNLKDIQIFNAYLEKMDAAKGHQKES